MRNLIVFLIKHCPLFLCLFYVIVSLVFLTRYNTYHRSLYLSSANRLSGEIFAVTGNLTGYFNLKEINQDLQERNGQLEMEILALKQQINDRTGDSLAVRAERDSLLRDYHFVVAQVIGNSVARPNNYIVLNKGIRDSLAVDMGVVDHNGLVGTVSTVGEHFSVVIPVLNSKFRQSCKVKGSEYFGSLVWDGRDPRYALLEELPRHVSFQVGDTVVTTGYSSMFPEGILVGTVRAYEKDKDDNFYALQVELSTDFCRLKDVRVIANKHRAEIGRLQEQAKGDE